MLDPRPVEYFEPGFLEQQRERLLLEGYDPDEIAEENRAERIRAQREEDDSE